MANDVFHSEKINFIVSQLDDMSRTYLMNSRRVRISSFTNNLKEISMSIKINLAHDSESAYNLLKLYASLKGLDIKDLNAVINAYVTDVEALYAKTNVSWNRGMVFILRIIDGINTTISEIDRHIETIRATYGIENSNDVRFNKTTPLNVYVETFNNSISRDDMVTPANSNRDITVDWSIDSMKQNCKMLNSFKNDIINSFNKTFGDKSIFAPLKLSEILVK